MFRLTGCSRETTLSDLLSRRTAITVKCEGSDCGRMVKLFDDLRALPGGATLGDLAGRMRCSACGGATGWIGTVNNDSAGGNRS